MDILEEARKFRAFIETMAESVDDDTAKEHIDVFPLWKVDTAYTKDFRLRYNEVLYKVLQDHTSQSDWTPDKAVSLYVRIDDPQEEWPEWIAPTGAHDAYQLGAKVSHNGHHWISLIDNNVWEPTTDAPTLWELQPEETSENPEDPETPVEPEEPEELVEEEIPEFVQPTGGEDAYNTGDIVMFNDKKYESLIDNNVWSPEAYPQGWREIE